jgi:hypothetical protein
MDTILKNITKVSAIAIVVVSSAFTWQQADIFDNVASAIKNNSAKDVAGYFNSSVDMNIEGSDGVYSKTQAEMVLKNFFVKYPCNSFAISHRGQSGGNNSFAIGAYKSGTNNFRVTIYVKEMSGKSLIHELKFERE